MMTTPNTDRSITDTHNINSRSEANYNDEDQFAEAASNCNSYDLISNRLDHTICSSNGVKDHDQECAVRKSSHVPDCRINRSLLDSLTNSTKKLLCLLEDVQAKTHSTALINDDLPKMADVLRPMANWDPNSRDIMDRSVTDIIGGAALERLEKQTQHLESIVITDKHDDCSVYQRLVRKCHCLNQQEYNDFIIHFNEQTKFCTNSIGEIIKNMLIVKKFLYMGGSYTKNALLFLNQGLEEGTYTEKADIIQACAFADICCVFDTYSIVTVCISWPCKNPSFKEDDTQEMTAKLLYNLSKLEEGRRYLNFNSKIICDIKKVLKKKQDKISYDTVEMLKLVLITCQPQTERPGMNRLIYHCRPMREGIGIKTLNALIAYRQYMTLNELFMHLDILKSLSSNEETQMQLTPHLPSILTLFKNILIEFNNDDINLIITSIMTNIVGDSVAKNNEREHTIVIGEKNTSCVATEIPHIVGYQNQGCYVTDADFLTSADADADADIKRLASADTGANVDPIKQKNVTIQVPVQRKSHKKVHHQSFKKSEQREINKSTLLNPIKAPIKQSDEKEINRSKLLNPITAKVKQSEQKEINRSRLLNPIAVRKSEHKGINRSRLLNPAAVRKSEHKGINRSRLLNPIVVRKSDHKGINRSRLLNPAAAKKSDHKGINRSRLLNPITAKIKQSEQKEINRSRLLNPAAAKKSDHKGINRSRLLNLITEDAIKQKNSISKNTNDNVFQKRTSVTVNLTAFHKSTENVFQREFPSVNRSRKFTSKDIVNVIVVPMEENDAVQ